MYTRMRSESERELAEMVADPYFDVKNKSRNRELVETVADVYFNAETQICNRMFNIEMIKARNHLCKLRRFCLSRMPVRQAT